MDPQKWRVKQHAPDDPQRRWVVYPPGVTDRFAQQAQWQAKGGRVFRGFYARRNAMRYAEEQYAKTHPPRTTVELAHRIAHNIDRGKPWAFTRTDAHTVIRELHRKGLIPNRQVGKP
ncbi:hypothetical protein [Corynebacterium pseudopelargi]|uniref:Uncharacterized protein n=1 Tax=Corynebacterium pseudopelargi TaxID=2080757 RepID=A0A3G6ISZ6_9CORY|nr:hypothetical protein [Corynebacterium pseudopelargi]AZA08723.1 hypothetical protein CPPEL_02960 [Corynebacterium pseudopelargi]